MPPDRPERCSILHSPCNTGVESTGTHPEQRNEPATELDYCATPAKNCQLNLSFPGAYREGNSGLGVFRAMFYRRDHDGLALFAADFVKPNPSPMGCASR